MAAFLVYGAFLSSLQPVAFVSQAAPRFLLFVALATAFSLAWCQLNRIPMLVIGQPITTGMLQSEMEAPFFADLGRTTGLPLDVTYKSLDSTGIKDTFQLPLLKEGSVDLVSLRFIQNSHHEPGLSGIDFPGLIQSFAQARHVASAYSPTLNRYLQQTGKARLLSIWTFGPQVLFCRQPISHLDEIRGLKVRVASDPLALIFKGLGATPAVIPFDQTRNALAIGLIDCAVTSAASANYAGWLRYMHVQYQLPFQYGLNGYVVSQHQWAVLTPAQRRVLAATFKAFEYRLWRYSESLENDVTRCNTGGPCRRGVAYQLRLVRPSAHELDQLQVLALTKLLPAWSAACERAHAGCLREWRQTVLPLSARPELSSSVQ